MIYKPLFFKHEAEITKKLQKHFARFEYNNLDISTYQFDDFKNIIPELEEDFNYYHFTVEKFYLFQTQKAVTPIHVDLDKKWSPNLVLNWPIFNCDQSVMKFYTPNKNAVGSVVNDSWYEEQWAGYEPDQCTLIDQFELLSPHLIDTSIPHHIQVNHDKLRLVMSFRFKLPPLYLWN